MDKDKEIQAKTEAFLNNAGMNLPQLFQLLGKNKSSVLNLDDVSQTKFSNLYNKIKNKNFNKRDKGKLLEDLVGVLFQEGSSKLFNTRKNCRTSTNEIDLLLEWSNEARILGLNTAYPCFGDSFICECKNYEGKISVTYIGKFCSLLNVTGTTLGIMIAWDGITGRGKWDASQGLLKKVALKQGIYVIILDKYDLKDICDKKNNIFSLIHEKYLALKDDLDYSQYIKPHEAETMLKI